MKTFTIEITGTTQSDIEQAIEEVARWIRRDMLSGFNSNDTGSYSFDSSGEYESEAERLHCEGWCPDYRRQPKTEHFCYHCQRDIKPGSKYRLVHVIDGGGNILHPSEEATYSESDPGNMGSFPVGMDCARRIGMDWTTAPEVQS